MLLDVRHQLEPMDLLAGLSSQGFQSLIRLNDSPISRLLQIVPLDVVPDESHSLGPCSPLCADDGFQHWVNSEPLMQVLVADIWTPVDTPLSHPSPSSNFGSILLPGQVIAVVEQ